MSSETSSPQRSSEDDDLLACSTKKSKVGGGSTGGNTLAVDAGSPSSVDVGAQAEADEEMVAETPLEELPVQNESDSAMQIETIPASPIAGDQDAVDGAAKDLPSEVPADVRPRSYLDSVVGQGSDAVPFLAEVTVRDSDLPVGQEEGFMVDIHAEGTEIDQSSPGTECFNWKWQGGGASTSGSRFAPLEGTDDREQIPVAIPDAVPVRENGERSTADLTRVPQQSRAAPVAAESSSPRTSNRGLRRAVEEDEHTINRGEHGGAVVSTTRVLNSDHGEPASTDSAGPSNEHYGDPPDGVDCEGDVVMEIEDQQGTGHAEGDSVPSA
nr:uncharacterized protein LOC109156749 [Ipomoea batatas]